MVSFKAATNAATDMQPKTRIFSQCQLFCKLDNLFFLATRYMWFGSMNVSGIVLIAPVRLMKFPRKGSKADRKVVIIR